MISKNKKYFTLFGMLCATVDRKISSIYSLIHSLMSIDMPKIVNLLISRQLKPAKLYSTNKIK
ncbi:conserved hypothetical protein [Arcobacter nitrofigilis DSM 7299]|jgi:hypothetical protein|uniref:Uncharacterized protein n=1 Tax=Arcobacter nitrofigilis (strain ATCC 33309 / DSM 7299 / CCUG 15893 / LMG 7604 / NCTC 12251 / CI) TaxID=572480 RepID=D5V1S0_ARCNC|nr:hypothetical protein [Arcobacter nitrofigilis]ADG93504.1 conserved hypothetical protein [Arcobacter nitrofigilis DSM 7299]